MNRPVYMQIVVFLRKGILTGEYPDGKIPATASLAQRFHTSPSTVSHAYAALERDGLIAREPYKPPVVIARAEPYRDNRYVRAVTRDGSTVFCQQCWAPVQFLGPTGGHVCQ